MITSYERNNNIENSVLINIDNRYDSIILLGKAETDKKNGEIIKPNNLDEAFKLYGNSDLYDAYEQSINLGLTEVYTMNCFNRSDYITAIDKLIHYNFAYIIPINLFLSDTFYDPIKNEHRYYANFFIESLNEVDSFSTVIFTDKHAQLYEDIDHYLIDMKNMFLKYKQDTNTSFNNALVLQECGNDLIFVLNTLEDIEYSNVILGAMLANSYPSKYPTNVNFNTVFDIDQRDVLGFEFAYFKYSYCTDNTSIDNLLNLRSSQDIYKNVIIDIVIKHIIRSLDLSSFKGKMYNLYTKIQIENETKSILNKLRGVLFKEYAINKIGFTNSTLTSGYVYLELGIQPHGTFETIKIVMGV